MKKELAKVEREIVAAQPQQAQQAPALMKPLVDASTLIEHHKQLAELIAKAMESGRDYGVIPGTGQKPVLLKPGAERIAMAFGCYPQYQVVEREIDHDHKNQWKKYKTGTVIQGESQGLYRYVVRCTLIHRPTGQPVGDGLASASSLESKYVDRPRDLENTILKMAQKRALIAAVLNTFGLSDRFTQDIEDLEPAEQPGQEEPIKSRTEKLKQALSPSPLRRLYDAYKAAGGTDDDWKAKLTAAGITQDPETHTPERLGWLKLSLKLDQDQVRE